MLSMHAECEMDAIALLLFSIEVLTRFSRLLGSSAATVGGKQRRGGIPAWFMARHLTVALGSNDMGKKRTITQGEPKVKLATTTTKVEDTIILHCKGRLQFCEEAAIFSKLAHGILDAGRNLVLNFDEVEMIDSTGIGELVLIYMRACGAGKEVRIASPTKRVLDVLELTNVSSLFRTCSTVDEALEYSPEEVA